MESSAYKRLRTPRGLQDHLGRHRLSVPLFSWCNSPFVMAAIPRQSWNLRVTPDDQQLIDRHVCMYSVYVCTITHSTP